LHEQKTEFGGNFLKKGFKLPKNLAMSQLSVDLLPKEELGEKLYFIQ